MSDFESRRDAFEDKFAHDAEMMFRAEARACKLFGIWLAAQLGLSSEEANIYAKGVVGANLAKEGFDDVIAHVMPDIQGKGLDISAQDINLKMAAFMDEAKVQLMQDGS